MANKNNRNIKIIWNLRELAEAVAGLPVEGSLPARTVLVSSERAAHSLRKELIRGGQESILIGTRFLCWGDAAMEVLSEDGASFRPGEERLRPARLREIFKNPPKLKYFKKELLTATPGWDSAFASTIAELEGAGISSGDGAKFADDERLLDVFALWQYLDKQAGDSWTINRIFDEAARVLEKNSTNWPFPGPVLFPVSSEMSLSQAAFARFIPKSMLLIWGARPLREHYLDRMAGLFGEEVREAIGNSECPRSSGSELEILTSYLFEKPEILADPARPRSKKLDNTVHFEEYSGVEDEIEAAADWVGRQIYEEAVPLSEMAILVPSIDPWASLLVERISRLPHANDPIPAFVAGGLPITANSGGARILRVLRALENYLPAEDLVEILPTLCLEPDESRKHLSRGEAIDLIYTLGTPGGSAVRREDALAWRDGLARKEKSLKAEVEIAQEQKGKIEDDENQKIPWVIKDSVQMLANLQGTRAAFLDLVELAELILRGSNLQQAWEKIQAFLDRHLLIVPSGNSIVKILSDNIEPALSDPIVKDLKGEEALRFILETFESLRVPTGRFGEPAIYIGSLPGAGGLFFQAVRIIGLAEGTLPTAFHQDSILPNEIREKLMDRHKIRLSLPEDKALAQLHGLDRTLRGTGKTLVLSAPRMDVDRTNKEFSSVFIEAAAAIGRSGSGAGESGKSAFDLRSLRRDYFIPAREYQEKFRESAPLSPANWQGLAAQPGHRKTLPKSWGEKPEFDIEKCVSLMNPSRLGPMEGIFSKKIPEEKIPGLTTVRAISASKLQTLLQCPYRFLLQHILGWEEPDAAPSFRDIDPLSFGSLVHDAAAAFAGEHGQKFGQKGKPQDYWLKIGEGMAEELFKEFLEEYPLIGKQVRENEYKRFWNNFRNFIEYDWKTDRPREYFGAEWVFGGNGKQVRLNLSSGQALFLRGKIDRIDIVGEQDCTLIWDLKTGKSYPRIGDEAGPVYSRDLQIAVYGLVIQSLARELKIPDRIRAAYIYTDPRGEAERGFKDDFNDLVKEAKNWLKIAYRLLAEQQFPRTPDQDDCTFCYLSAACGDVDYEGQKLKLEKAGGAPADLCRLKYPEK